VAGNTVDEFKVIALGKGDGEKNELIHREGGGGDDLPVELIGVAETLADVDAGELAPGIGDGPNGDGAEETGESDGGGGLAVERSGAEEIGDAGGGGSSVADGGGGVGVGAMEVADAIFGEAGPVHDDVGAGFETDEAVGELDGPQVAEVAVFRDLHDGSLFSRARRFPFWDNFPKVKITISRKN
jgi:hypothetical protein